MRPVNTGRWLRVKFVTLTTATVCGCACKALCLAAAIFRSTGRFHVPGHMASGTQAGLGLDADAAVGANGGDPFTPRTFS